MTAAILSHFAAHAPDSRLLHAPDGAARARRAADLPVPPGPAAGARATTWRCPTRPPRALELEPQRLHPVGMLERRYCQAGWVDSDALPPEGYAWRGAALAVRRLDEELLGLAGTRRQIAEWARTHRFCGACGSRMALVGGERCFKCAGCGHMAYPRISPAMMVLIRKGDAVLLALHSQSAGRRFSALAGFLEAGRVGRGSGAPRSVRGSRPARCTTCATSAASRGRSRIR